MASVIHTQKSHCTPAQRHRPPAKGCLQPHTAGGAKPRVTEAGGVGRAAGLLSPTCRRGQPAAGPAPLAREEAPLPSHPLPAGVGDGRGALITAAGLAQPARRFTAQARPCAGPSWPAEEWPGGPRLPPFLPSLPSRHSPRPLGWPRLRSARLGSAAALAPWLPTASTSPCATPPSLGPPPPPLAPSSACSTSGGRRPSTGEAGRAGGSKRGGPAWGGRGAGGEPQGEGWEAAASGSCRGRPGRLPAWRRGSPRPCRHPPAGEAAPVERGQAAAPARPPSGAVGAARASVQPPPRLAQIVLVFSIFLTVNFASRAVPTCTGK